MEYVTATLRKNSGLHLRDCFFLDRLVLWIRFLFRHQPRMYAETNQFYLAHAYAPSHIHIVCTCTYKHRYRECVCVRGCWHDGASGESVDLTPRKHTHACVCACIHICKHMYTYIHNSGACLQLSKRRVQLCIINV